MLTLVANGFSITSLVGSDTSNADVSAIVVIVAVGFSSIVDEFKLEQKIFGVSLLLAMQACVVHEVSLLK